MSKENTGYSWRYTPLVPCLALSIFEEARVVPSREPPTFADLSGEAIRLA